jgi:hypothetical protein
MSEPYHVAVREELHLQREEHEAQHKRQRHLGHRAAAEEYDCAGQQTLAHEVHLSWDVGTRHY